MEEIIRQFWNCSLRSNFEDFDWDEAFDEFEPHLSRKLIEHGLCEYDEFRDYFDEVYGINSMESDVMGLYWAVTETNYISFSDVDVVEAILQAKFKAFNDAFEGVHSHLTDLRDRINDRRGLSEPKLICLFDECIHAQHESGEILEDVDIESLREEAESEWQEEQKEKNRFPTNIREFLTID